MDVQNKQNETDPSLKSHFKGHRGEITGLSFNPDGTQLVSCSTDSTLMLWNFKKKAHAIKFENHDDSVTGVHFSSNGKFIASCSKDRSVRLWKTSVSKKNYLNFSKQNIMVR